MTRKPSPSPSDSPPQSPSLSLAIPARIPDLSGNEPRDKVFFSDVRASDRHHPRRVDWKRRTARHPDLRSQARRSSPGPAADVPASPSHSQPVRPARAALGCRGSPGRLLGMLAGMGIVGASRLSRHPAGLDGFQYRRAAPA